jgi:hypothetical protein
MRITYRNFCQDQGSSNNESNFKTRCIHPVFRLERPKPIFTLGKDSWISIAQEANRALRI